MVSKIRPFWTEIRENGLAATVLQVGYIPYKVKELKVEIAVAVYKITKEIQAVIADIIGLLFCENT